MPRIDGGPVVADGARGAERSPPWRTLVAAYLQIAWLLLGASGLARGRTCPPDGAGGGRGHRRRPGVGRPALAGPPDRLRGRALPGGRLRVPLAARRPSGRRRPPALVGGNSPGALVLYAVDQFAYFGLSFVPREPARAAPAVHDVRRPRDRGHRDRPRGLAPRGRARAAGPRGGARAAARAGAGLRLSDLGGHPDRMGPAGAVPLDPREPGRRAARAELLHRPPRPDVGPGELPVLLRRARHDPGPEAARAGPDGVRPAHRPAPAGDARGLPGSRRARRGRAHRQRLRGLAGGAAAGARRGDRGGGRPDLRPRGAPRAGRARPLRVRVRPDRRRHRGQAGGGRAAAERDPAARGDPAGARPCCGRPTRSCASPRRWARACPPSASPRTRSSGCRWSSTSGPGARSSIATGSPCAASRPATSTSTMAAPSPCTSSPCATRRAPSGARWGSRSTSPTSVVPTGPCASRKPGCAR